MTYFALIFASFFAAFLSGSAGFGGALLLLPVVTACIGVEAAIPVLTVAQLIGNISRMAFGFKRIAWKSVAAFCATALPLASLGAFSFSVLPKDVVTRCIGMAIIIFALLKTAKKIKFRANKKILLAGGAIAGLLSGLAGSSGPLGASVFLSLGLPPVAYIASEATTATAMHLLKTIIYSNLVNVGLTDLLTGIVMGIVMIFGTFAANKKIKKMKTKKFQKYVTALLFVTGLYMLIVG